MKPIDRIQNFLLRKIGIRRPDRPPGTAARPATPPSTDPDEGSATSIPDRWSLAIRPATSGPKEPNDETHEWLFIAVHEFGRKETTEISAFYWHVGARRTQEALPEITDLLRDGAPHGDGTVERIAHLYEKYGRALGPASAMLKISGITATRTIPDGEPSRFHAAITVGPDPFDRPPPTENPTPVRTADPEKTPPPPVRRDGPPTGGDSALSTSPAVPPAADGTAGPAAPPRR